MHIHYTTDGSIPGSASDELKGPLVIKKSVHLRVAAVTTAGLRGDIYDLNFKKQDYAVAKTKTVTKPGLTCNYYKAFFRETSLISSAKPDSTFTTDVIAVPQTVKAPSFAVTYRGYINVPVDGVYSFYLTCDDGGILRIADRETVDNDGLHSAIEKDGQVALRKGLQPFALDFIEGGGGFTLKLKYSVNNSAPVDIPASWFRN